MHYKRAFFAGVLGGFVMTIIMVIARIMGMPVNLELMLGTMLGLSPGAGTWLVGFLMHLIISGLIGLAYGGAFEYISHKANAGLGIAFAFIHTLIAGIILGIIPMMHPMIPEMMNAPGAFMANMGFLGVVFLFIEHLIYGAIVGSVYGEVLHRHKGRAHEPSLRHV